MKALENKSANLHPEVISAAFRIKNIMQKYELLIASDKQVAFLLHYIDECLEDASLGDEQALKKFIREGGSMLEKIVKMLQLDALAEQTEDDESAAICNDECRIGLDYIELRKEIIAFKKETLENIQAIKI